MILSPKEHYLQQVESGKIQLDSQQIVAIEYLDGIYYQLIKQAPKNRWDRWRQAIGKLKAPIKGAYLYGPVGSGKTRLLDIFYNSLQQNTQKANSITMIRIHFHEFMKKIHHQLKQLKQQQNPLDVIASHFQKYSQIICFDEFIVNNIVDAMILGNLLQAFFKKNICFIATSNFHPQKLYYKGLQRHLFLPTIVALEKNLNIIHIDNHIDYRRQNANQPIANQPHQLANYFYPINEASQQMMTRKFKQLATNTIVDKQIIYILGRPISTIKCDNETTIWFDFANICQKPRHALDYLEMSKRFNNIFISGLNTIPATHNDQIRLFINLIDVLYNEKIVLYIESSVAIDEIYPSGKLIDEFSRTKSRLIEMQTTNYLYQHR